jgi:peptide/nickel transport system substrate-binding protein
MKRLKCVAALALIATLMCMPAAAKTGKVLKIASWEDVNTFDPAYMTSGERELTVMSCLYNGLVKYKEGSWDVVPDLAESWKVSQDGKTVTFKLRKGVMFQKGYGEMTAEDVKFSLERMADPKANSPYKGSWSSLERVDVVNKYTVKLILKHRMVSLFSSVLPMNTGMIVSKKAVLKMGKDKFSFNPVGTGPYELEKWEPKQRLVLKAFTNYWGPKPAIQKIEIIPIVEDATSETALKTGEIQVGRCAMINMRSFEKDKRFQVVSKPPMKTYWLGMTVNKPPFDNLKLREAFRYAVDVNKIVEAAFFGTATRANTILPASVPGSWTEAPAYKQNVAKAKQLMKEAGKPDGFKVNLLVPASDTERIMAEVIQQEAAKAGIEVQISSKEIGAFNDAVNKGEPNAYIQFYTATIDPSYMMVYFTGSDWNPSQWHNARYNELLKKAMSEPDDVKRNQLYVDAQKEIDKDCWAIWLTNGSKVWVAKNDVNLGLIYPNGRLAPWTMSFK